MLNNKLNVLVVDDELNAREFLKKLVVRHFSSKINKVLIASNLQTAIELLVEERVDLLFLDVQLGKENGFDLLKQFENRDFKVVFTTAHKEYALDAIKESAFDYLLKPINYIDLLDVFKKIEQLKIKEDFFEKLSSLSFKLSPLNVEYNKIAFPTKEGLRFVHISDIVYCVASGSYSDVILSDNSKITVSKPLKYFEGVLPVSLFFRCHKSYFVNLNFADNYNDSNKQITLVQGIEIPVSLRKKEAFIHAISRK